MIDASVTLPNKNLLAIYTPYILMYASLKNVLFFFFYIHATQDGTTLKKQEKITQGRLLYVYCSVATYSYRINSLFEKSKS